MSKLIQRSLALLLLPFLLLTCKKEPEAVKRFRVKTYTIPGATYHIEYKDSTRISKITRRGSDNLSREEQIYFYQGKKLSRIEASVRQNSGDPFQLAMILTYTWFSQTELELAEQTLMPANILPSKYTLTFNTSGHLIKLILGHGSQRFETIMNNDSHGNFTSTLTRRYENNLLTEVSESTSVYDQHPNPYYRLDLIIWHYRKFNQNNAISSFTNSSKSGESSSQTNYEYNDQGYPVKITRSLGGFETFTYENY